MTIDTFKPPHAFQPLGGVAVIADNTWAAFQGRHKLKVDWENGPHAVYNSGEFRKTLSETARLPGKVVRNIGDVDAAFAKGGKIVEAEYYAPTWHTRRWSLRSRWPMSATARLIAGRRPKIRKRCKKHLRPFSG